ncbi:MAG: hypothetical protein JXR76_17640 [Deltaproteobacteria bacterium]|nr:hypothetical protein [Deltaproteobacteria bacterium]
MNESKDGLYNVNDAKVLSMRLSGARKPTDSERESPYIRFASGTTAAPRVVPMEQKASDVTVPKPTITQPEDPFENWEAMTKWCMETAKAKACFVVDPQGFILMREGGEAPEDGYEGAGANLLSAMDQLRHMELDSDDIQVMELTYRRKGVLVIRARDTDNDFFTLCLIDSSGVTEAHKKMIYQQIQKNLLLLT